MKKYQIGIDLGGTNIKGSIFDESWNLLKEKRLPTEAQNGSDHVINRMILLVNSLLEESKIEKNEISCMGMGIPGLLDPIKGISLFSPNFPQWENVHIAEVMQQYFQFPVFIDNDVRINLYGEWKFGAGKGKKNIVLLTLGTGLGSGIVMDENVLYGSTSSAGEIGHMNMFREGRPCKCGSSGCLGRYVSAVGMVKTFIEKVENGRDSVICEWVSNDLSSITAKMISEAYDLNDMPAIETMHETGEILGFGLVNIINLFNPEIIIIGGGMAAAGERLLNYSRKIVDSHALKISNQNCVITTAELGDSAGMIGAAVYANQKIQC